MTSAGGTDPAGTQQPVSMMGSRAVCSVWKESAKAHEHCIDEYHIRMSSETDARMALVATYGRWHGFVFAFVTPPLLRALNRDRRRRQSLALLFFYARHDRWVPTVRCDPTRSAIAARVCLAPVSHAALTIPQRLRSKQCMRLTRLEMQSAPLIP